MSEKIKEKRQTITLTKSAHKRLKIMSVREDRKLENLIDEAVLYFLKTYRE